MLHRGWFVASLSAGLVLLAATASAFVASPQAFPFFVGNVGSFTVAADALEADGFALDFEVDENSGSNGGAMPVGELSLNDAVVAELMIKKGFDVSSVIGDIAQAEWVFRLAVPGETRLVGPTVYVAALCAGEMAIGDLVIDGAGTNTATFQDDLRIGGARIAMRDVHIQSTYLAVEALTLNDVVVSLEPGAAAPPGCVAG